MSVLSESPNRLEPEKETKSLQSGCMDGGNSFFKRERRCLTIPTFADPMKDKLSLKQRIRSRASNWRRLSRDLFSFCITFWLTNIFIIYFQLDQEVCSQGTSTTSKRRFEHGADDDGATTWERKPLYRRSSWQILAECSYSLLPYCIWGIKYTKSVEYDICNIWLNILALYYQH